MATPDARTALKVNGRLCWNPTDLSGTYPFGGTALGLAIGKALKYRSNTHVIRAEEAGGGPVDALYAGEEHVFVAILNGWDTDALAALFLDAAAGATTGRAVVKSRPFVDDVRAGTLVSANAGILYFSPDADQHPGVLMRRALPMVEESARLEFNLARELGTPMAWLLTPPTDGNPQLEVGLRQDLSI